MRQALTKIQEIADISSTAVAEVGIQCFGACGAQENGSQEPEGAGIGAKEVESIVRAEGAEYGKIVGKVNHAQDGQHAEPDEHDRAEELADGSGAELL
jgi:hypothetical protein